MSQFITESFVKQFSANIFHLSQQKGSRLQGLVRKESQNAESKFFERIGSVEAQEKIGRHTDVEYSDTPHSRRRVSLTDYFYADLVDEEDKLRMLISPESPYAQAAIMALGRSKDDKIIAAALGNAYAGKEGNTVVGLPDSQKVACHDGVTTTGNNLNVKTLRAVKAKFDSNDIDESIARNFAISSSQLQSLLGEEEVTSTDFASVKALVMGEVDTFMGFKFTRLERLPANATDVTYNINNGSVGAGTGTITASKSRRCFAWAQDGLILSTGKDVTAKITEIPHKHYANQVYAKMGIGAVRMEEVKVVEVLCSEN